MAALEAANATLAAQKSVGLPPVQRRQPQQQQQRQQPREVTDLVRDVATSQEPALTLQVRRQQLHQARGGSGRAEASGAAAQQRLQHMRRDVPQTEPSVSQTPARGGAQPQLRQQQRPQARSSQQQQQQQLQARQPAAQQPQASVSQLIGGDEADSDSDECVIVGERTAEEAAAARALAAEADGRLVTFDEDEDRIASSGAAAGPSGSGARAFTLDEAAAAAGRGASADHGGGAAPAFTAAAGAAQTRLVITASAVGSHWAARVEAEDAFGGAGSARKLWVGVGEAPDGAAPDDGAAVCFAAAAGLGRALELNSRKRVRPRAAGEAEGAWRVPGGNAAGVVLRIANVSALEALHAAADDASSGGGSGGAHAERFIWEWVADEAASERAGARLVGAFFCVEGVPERGVAEATAEAAAARRGVCACCPDVPGTPGSNGRAVFFSLATYLTPFGCVACPNIPLGGPLPSEARRHYLARQIAEDDPGGGCLDEDGARALLAASGWDAAAAAAKAAAAAAVAGTAQAQQQTSASSQPQEPAVAETKPDVSRI